MYFVYILYSQIADKYYVGQTDDPDRRLLEHNKLSENKFTSKYRPWKCIACFPVGKSRGLAMKIERHIKKQRSRSYIKNLAKLPNIDKLIDRFTSLPQKVLRSQK